MIEDPFYGPLPEGERPDLMLYIFPHLPEFLAVDLRAALSPKVVLLHTDAVFQERFFHFLETEFAAVMRDDGGFPFAHLINLPLRLEEVTRSVAMSVIMEHLELPPPEREEDWPTVVVLVVSGGALAMHSERLRHSLRELLQAAPGDPYLDEWEKVLSRLIAAENAQLQKLSQQELTEAMRDDSPDYFTLWENRN